MRRAFPMMALALAIASTGAEAGSQSSNTSSNSSSNNGVVRERIADSYCENGYCDRVIYRRTYRDDRARYRERRDRQERYRHYRDRHHDDD